MSHELPAAGAVLCAAPRGAPSPSKHRATTPPRGSVRAPRIDGHVGNLATESDEETRGLALSLFRRVALAGMASACVACAADFGQGPDLQRINASLLIHNRSQFDLVELRVHADPDYRSSANLLGAAMEQEQHVLFYGEGNWFVTHFREAYARGPIRAFTTKAPVALELRAGYRLTIFDESFRLEPAPYLPPEQADAPIFGVPFPDGRPGATGTSTASS